MKDTTIVVLKHCIPCNIMQTKLQSEQIGYFKGYCNQKGQCCQVAGERHASLLHRLSAPARKQPRYCNHFYMCVFMQASLLFAFIATKQFLSLSPSLCTYTGTHTHRLTHVSICIYTHNISKHSYFAGTVSRQTRFILAFPSNVLCTIFHVSNNYR